MNTMLASSGGTGPALMAAVILLVWLVWPSPKKPK